MLMPFIIKSKRHIVQHVWMHPETVLKRLSSFAYFSRHVTNCWTERVSPITASLIISSGWSPRHMLGENGITLSQAKIIVSQS